jgi:hypothetical protein
MNERSVNELQALRRRLDRLVFQRTYRQWSSRKALIYHRLATRELELIAAGETEAYSGLRVVRPCG